MDLVVCVSIYVTITTEEVMKSLSHRRSFKGVRVNNGMNTVLMHKMLGD